MNEQIEKQAIEEMAKTIGSTWVVDLEGNPHDLSEVLMDCDIENIAEQLYERNYRKQEWIRVDERLPSKSGKYICCTTKGTILIERFYQLDDGGWFSNHDFCTVTHWMPLPEPPRKEDENGKATM